MGDASTSGAARAGLAYALAVFAIGFALGTVRVLLLAPRMGAATAVSIEAPLMLGASWWISRRCIRHFRVARAAPARVLMGAVAFLVLMLEEVALAWSLGSSPAGYLSSLASPAGAIGLAAQVAFALIPLAQGLRCCSMRARSASS